MHTVTLPRRWRPAALAAFLALVCAGLLAAATLLLASPAHAQETYEVTTTDDTQQCDDDECSLRGAILAANDDPDTAATIVLDAETYLLTGDGALPVTSEITVEGEGPDQTSIQPARSHSRVFEVDAGGDLTLDAVEVASGFTDADGGAIHADRFNGLVLHNTRVADSEAGGSGGGLAAVNGADGAEVVVRAGSVIEGNEASGYGGGVYLATAELPFSATIEDSSIRDNVASAGGGFFQGSLIGAQQHTTIVGSTLSGNTAEGRLGGGAIRQEGGEISVENSTISGNATNGEAGAIFNAAEQGADSIVDLTHVTIAQNAIEAWEPVATAVRNDDQMTALATIVAENAAPEEAGDAPACAGDIDSQGHNLEDGDSCGFDDATDLTDTDPDLEPLALNEPGLTETHALPAGSPAVDHVDATTLNVDQRGVSRPGAGSSARDIGAYELVQDTDGLAITKDAPSPVLVGEQFDYEIVVSNEAEVTAPGVQLTDELPSQVAFESVDPAANCDEDDGELTCALGDLAPGDSEVVTVTVTAETPTSSATNAALATSETEPGGVTASTDVTITNIPFACIPEDFEDGTGRVWGEDRFDTAIGISEDCYDDGEADAVVLTRADIFPDALSGTPLAVQENAPLLFSMPDELHPGTEGELQRVLPAGGEVYLLGETAALSEEVEQRVEDLGYNAVRLGGADRYETAVEIVEQGLSNPASVLLATGIDFPDPLAGAAGEAINGGVLLTRGDDMASVTQDYLDGRTDDPEVYAIGGPAATAAPDATPIFGVDRFATAVDVAEEFFSTPRNVGIATGGDFADALAGGVQLGKLGGPMLLVREDELPPVVETYLEDNASSIERALIFGGPAAVDTAVEDEISDIIDP